MCVQGGFSYSGQRCTAVKVVLVMEQVADQLVEKVNKGMADLTVGMPEVLPCCPEIALKTRDTLSVIGEDVCLLWQ